MTNTEVGDKIDDVQAKLNNKSNPPEARRLTIANSNSLMFPQSSY